MIFRRRDSRPMWRILWEMIYPRGGWGRAFRYVKHRLKRLPGTPERIARGIAVGVFTAFTPFYGLHFMVAAILAVVIRGNVLAALFGTFFGNPLTYLPIAVVSLGGGHFLLGTELEHNLGRGVIGKFFDASADLWCNLIAVFTGQDADWSGLARFNADIFLPWLVGGIVPGLICGVIAYALSVPVLRAYQNRRKGALKQKLAELKAKAAAAARKTSED